MSNKLDTEVLSINTLRLALSGALIGVALVGLTHLDLPYGDIIGGIVGFVATIIAKYRHLF
jgi:hypothetical protein